MPGTGAASLPAVTVVVVSYRTRDLTVAAIGSLLASTRSVPLTVRVVDNAGRDGTVEAVRESYPQVEVLEQATNLGFGAAVNVGARDLRTPYLLLLNPDTTVHEGAVDRLVEFAEAHPEHGLYGGQTLDGQGRVDARSVWGSPTLWSLFCWGVGLSTAFPRTRLDPESIGAFDRRSVREVPVVIGAWLLVRGDAWRALGGFDESFFMYSEDVDLSLRARRAGWRPVMTPAAQITHLIGASTPKQADKRVMVMAGRVTLVRKHWSPPAAAAGRALLLLGVAVRALGQRVSHPTSRDPDDDRTAWLQVWRQRRRWSRGWRNDRQPDRGAEAAPTVEGGRVRRAG